MITQITRLGGKMSNKIRTNVAMKNIKPLIFILGIILIVIDSYINRYAWADEIFSLQLIKENIPHILYGTMLDVHPPFYYVFLKIVVFFHMNVFQEVFFARFVTASFYLLLVFIVDHLLGKLNYNGNFRLIFSAFCIFGPNFFQKSMEIRMYAIGMSFLTIVFLLLILAKKKENVSYFLYGIIFTVLSLYTQYFLAIYIGFLYAFFLIENIIRKNKIWIKFFLSGLVSLLLYSPWMYAIYFQLHNKVQQATIAPQISFSKLTSYIVAIFMSTDYSKAFGISKILIFITFVMVLLLLLLALLNIKSLKKMPSDWLLIIKLSILMYFLGIMLNITMTMILKKPMYGHYLLLIAQIVWLGIFTCMSAFSSKNKKFVTSLVLLICFFNVLGSQFYLFENEKQFDNYIVTLNKFSKKKYFVTDSMKNAYITSYYFDKKNIILTGDVKPYASYQFVEKNLKYKKNTQKNSNAVFLKQTNKKNFNYSLPLDDNAHFIVK